MKLKNIKYFSFTNIYCLVAFLSLVLISPHSAATAALVSLEGSSAPQAITNSALVSKEARPLDVKFIIRQETDKARGMLVSYENEGFNGTFVLRQQKNSSGAALTAKPAALDMRILNIINDENIRSLEDYSTWLKKNFTYKKDAAGKDDWAIPDETLTRRRGDCEDFAFLNEAVLRIFGYAPQVLGLGGGLTPVNHAICFFKKDSHYLWFDNTTLKTTPAASFEEFSKYVMRACGYSYFFKINKNKRILLSTNSR